ncbi:hypothetical protein D3C87_1703720 [compost metagenome]
MRPKQDLADNLLSAVYDITRASGGNAKDLASLVVEQWRARLVKRFRVEFALTKFP